MLTVMVGAALPASAIVVTDKPVYTVDAIRYGAIADFPVRGLVAGADPPRKMNIVMMVWLVRGNGRNILVNAGFYRNSFFQQWTIRNFRKPCDAVAAAEVKPEDITDIIVTYLHWESYRRSRPISESAHLAAMR